MEPTSGGKQLSALRSAADKNLAAVRGGHSLAEAVLHLALTLLGLIRSFHPETLHSLFTPENQRSFPA